MRNGMLAGGFADAEDHEFSLNKFPSETWRQIIRVGTIFVGGLETE